MRYVLDANVALKWVLPESDDVKAIRIRDEFGQGIHAEQQGCELLTADDRLVRALRATFPFLTPLASMP